MFMLKINVSTITKFLKMELEELYDPIVEQIKDSAGIISGSCILQAIYKEKWGSDIDIFIKKENSLEKLFSETNNDKSDNQFEEILQTKYKKTEDQKDYYPETFIHKIHTYSHRTDDSKSKIQIIELTCSPEFFVFNNFDFPIIKNIFKFLSDGSPYLYVSEKDDIINRRTVFFSGIHLNKSLYRCHKYITKYKINITFNIDKTIDSFFKQFIEKHKTLEMFSCENCNDTIHFVPKCNGKCMPYPENYDDMEISLCKNDKSKCFMCEKISMLQNINLFEQYHKMKLMNKIKHIYGYLSDIKFQKGARLIKI